MAIEVSEQVVDVLGRGSVAVPFFDIERQEGLVGVLFRLLVKLSEVVVEILDQFLIQVFTKKMGYVTVEYFGDQR